MNKLFILILILSLFHTPQAFKGLRETHLTCDVFVAGGGSGGTSAAIAAARNGAKVIIVQGRPVLGKI